MRRLFLLLLAAPFFLALAAAPAAAQIAPPAGTVTRLQGTATAVRSAMPRVLTVGDPIQIGDVLSTGTEAVLEIKMSDDSLFALGAETAFIVTDYTFGQGTGGATFRVIKGAFLATSGKIAQLAGNTMTVQTDVATIGIRGTTVWGGPLDGVPMQVIMLEGRAVTVENLQGRVELTTPNAGTWTDGGAPSPSAPWEAAKIARAVATVTFR